MKKIIIIFGVLSLLIFIRPALGLNTHAANTISTVNVEQTEETSNSDFADEALGGIKQFYNYTGFAKITGGNLIMILINTLN